MAARQGRRAGVWLTLAPQGGNLEGLRAGALAWFGRPLAALDAGEAALLVALARRPERTRPDRHAEAAPRRATPCCTAARRPRQPRRAAGGRGAHAAPPPAAPRPACGEPRHPRP
jgi:penicillin-binding protein 1C